MVIVSAVDCACWENTALFLYRSLAPITMELPPDFALPDFTHTQSLIFVDGLSINHVLAWRSKTPAMSGSVAAFASSDMFKTSVAVPKNLLGI